MTDKEVVTSAKDCSCRGWVVVAGSFAVHVFVYSVAFTYGILVPLLVDHFSSGRAMVGGVGSLMIGLSWSAGECALSHLP